MVLEIEITEDYLGVIIEQMNGILDIGETPFHRSDLDNFIPAAEQLLDYYYDENVSLEEVNAHTKNLIEMIDPSRKVNPYTKIDPNVPADSFAVAAEQALMAETRGNASTEEPGERTAYLEAEQSPTITERLVEGAEATIGAVVGAMATIVSGTASANDRSELTAADLNRIELETIQPDASTAQPVEINITQETDRANYVEQNPSRNYVETDTPSAATHGVPAQPVEINIASEADRANYVETAPDRNYVEIDAPVANEANIKVDEAANEPAITAPPPIKADFTNACKDIASFKLEGPVMAVQDALNGHLSQDITVDGMFGKGSNAALDKVLAEAQKNGAIEAGATSEEMIEQLKASPEYAELGEALGTLEDTKVITPDNKVASALSRLHNNYVASDDCKVDQGQTANMQPISGTEGSVATINMTEAFQDSAGKIIINDDRRSQLVKDIQDRVGFSKSGQDGIAGPNTLREMKQHIMREQDKMGMQQTGYPTEEYLDAMDKKINRMYDDKDNPDNAKIEAQKMNDAIRELKSDVLVNEQGNMILGQDGNTISSLDVIYQPSIVDGAVLNVSGQVVTPDPSLPTPAVSGMN